MGHKVKDKDEGHDQWADIAPRDLPEEVGLVADHKLNVVVKPKGRGEVEEERGRDRLSDQCGTPCLLKTALLLKLVKHTTKIVTKTTACFVLR